MEFLNITFYGNTLARWVTAILVLALLWLVLKVAGRLAARRLESIARRTATTVDDLLVDLVRRSGFFLLVFVWLRLTTLIVDLPEELDRVLATLASAALLLQVVLWGNGLIAFLVNRYKERALERDPAEATVISALGLVGKLVFWSLILLLALHNFGVEITTLVAGLGVSGIAVALAVQNILGDLFASLSIVFDKPFVLGDFVIVDTYMGTVEKIGLKTTRLRSLSGEQLIFSNADLLGSRIRNYKRMFERRIVFTFGVIYQTPVEKLEKIPGMVRAIIEGAENTRFDRAHFKEYGDSSLNFEVVYYVLVPDYNTYMDRQQAINLAIFRQFAAEGIEFAYPTRTLYVVGNGQAAEDSEAAGDQVSSAATGSNV
jgi:small-conductance mechanosensitive channel